MDGKEKDAFLDNREKLWAYEGIAYYAFSDDTIPGLRPVQRLYSPDLNTHLYTISPAEAKGLVQNQAQPWRYEGTAFYAFPEECRPLDATPVYRFWSGTLRYHYFTVDEDEKNELRSKYPDTWTYEGVAWFAYK